MEKRFWPFAVGPPEKFSDEDKAIVHFLKVAYEAGFDPYDLGMTNYGATANNHRAGEIIARGRRRWELILGAEREEVLSAYLDDFDSAAVAVLEWLRGADASEILAELQEHLVLLPGASRTFTLHVPVEAAVPGAPPVETRR
ncbi:MAG TPA: hypothetical protein VMV69_05135 [Pirellulales bacterium]|nr:hypothetical protein [Pirellulales bacterium]